MTDQIETNPPRALVKRSAIPAAPIHPLAALTTIVLDNMFGIIEFDPLVIPLTALAAGVINTAAVTFVQRYLAKDEWGVSIAKGLVMGIIAGVPYSVTGTGAGALLLGWAGMHEWIKLPPPKTE
jgi:hypothetical protein